MTRDVGLFAIAAVLAVSSPANAAAFDAKAANKVCVERYNTEKESGTVPAGMPKSKYVSQCTLSMKRNAQLQEELTEQTPAVAGGTNELTATTQQAGATAQPTNKPGNVTTPSFAGPKGN